MRPLWLHRPVLNWQDILRWASEAGIKKIIPPDQLQVTLATVRQPVDWSDLELQSKELVVPAGPKVVQIFGYTMKGLTFEHPDLIARHAELLERFPIRDHLRMRPHVTLFRGGRMPTVPYHGELVFGPEVASVFDEGSARNVKHVKVGESPNRHSLSPSARIGSGTVLTAFGSATFPVSL
jgi:hypothetical protein